MAKDAEVVLFIGGLNKDAHQDCEGEDRQIFELPYEQGALISQLAASNKNTGVIIISGRSEERRVGKECRSRWSPYH